MNCHFCAGSLHLKATFAELPRLTSIPASCVGAVDVGKSALSVMILSPIFNSCVFTYVTFPLTVRLPATTMLPVIVPPVVLNLVFATVFATAKAAFALSKAPDALAPTDAVLKEIFD